MAKNVRGRVKNVRGKVKNVRGKVKNVRGMAKNERGKVKKGWEAQLLSIVEEVRILGPPHMQVRVSMATLPVKN